MNVKITKRIELNFWKSCILNAVGILLAKQIMPTAISFDNLFSLLALVVLIWFMNWIIRPVLVVFALPFIIFTMGIGVLFINAFIIYWASKFIPAIDVPSYWAALWVSFLTSVLWWSLEMFRSERIAVFKERVSGQKEDNKSKDDDVIEA